MHFVACNYDSRHALFPRSLFLVAHTRVAVNYRRIDFTSPLFESLNARNGTHQWLDKGQALTEWKKSVRGMSILERTEACAILSWSFFLLDSLLSFVNHVKMEWKLLQLKQIQFIMRTKRDSRELFYPLIHSSRSWDDDGSERKIELLKNTRREEGLEIFYFPYSLFKSSLSRW